ncbi:MAG TPA: hypothetical protein VD997_04870 [Phycisphaerales bacterium]|nr:hypothetical protein [Phycisphaerales bacterium]
MFGNRKMLGLFALAAVAATGLAAAPASAGTYRGGRDRCESNVTVYRTESCAPKARVSVGFYGDSRGYRDGCYDRDRGQNRGYVKQVRREKWVTKRDRYDCR